MLSSAKADTEQQMLHVLVCASYNTGLTEIENRTVALRVQCEDSWLGGVGQVDKELDVRESRKLSGITRTMFPGWAKRDRKEPRKLQLYLGSCVIFLWIDILDAAVRVFLLYQKLGH